MPILQRKALALAALAALAIPAPVAAQRAEAFHERVKQYVVHDAPAIRIDSVRIVDGTGSPVRLGQSVLIRDGRIARVGTAAAVAQEKADVIIDGKGRTLIPGLVMVHEHLFFLDVLADVPNYNAEALFAPRAYLAFGATTIRTAGTMNGNDDIQAARMIRDGRFAGPEIHATAPFVNGPGSFAYQLRPISEPQDARRIVRFWADEGARYLGIFDRVGSIALGKQADLVLIDGKPDHDLKELGRIDLVFKNGIAYDPKKLIESVRGKIGR